MSTILLDRSGADIDNIINMAKRPKRPKDVNQLAKFIVDLATSSASSEKHTPKQTTTAKNTTKIKYKRSLNTLGYVSIIIILALDSRDYYALYFYSYENIIAFFFLVC